MKKIKEKIDATDLIYQIEFAKECANVGEDFESVKKFDEIIQELKENYTHEDGTNPYMSIKIQKDRAILKCDVWAKMAVVNFATKTGIWVQKVHSSFKNIRYYNGFN